MSSEMAQRTLCGATAFGHRPGPSTPAADRNVGEFHPAANGDAATSVEQMPCVCVRAVVIVNRWWPAGFATGVAVDSGEVRG